MEAQAKLGRVPAEAVAEVKAKAKFDVDRIDEIEKTVRHDVIAFLTNVSENVKWARSPLCPSWNDLFRCSRYGICNSALKQAGEIILGHLLALRKTVGQLSVR